LLVTISTVEVTPLLAGAKLTVIVRVAPGAMLQLSLLLLLRFIGETL
jgi:hypothetical protein